MFCRNCGAKMADNDHFCRCCGTMRAAVVVKRDNDNLRESRKVISHWITVCSIIMIIALVIMPVFTFNRTEKGKRNGQYVNETIEYSISIFDITSCVVTS